MRTIRWGVLGAAKIALEKVIPATQRAEACTVAAIASRSLEKAQAAAQRLNIPRAYGSYEALLDDPEIDAIYNPLPNHEHVPWSIRAAAKGKHVLCEKPIARDAAEARELILARDRANVKIGEAFMARTALQWRRAQSLVDEGRIGRLLSILCGFSYYNRDPQNVRQKPEWGGGALLDIGCYPVTLSRMLFRAEPARVSGAIERDPEFGIDRLTSAILEFPAGHCVFTCSMQMVPYQRVQLLGTHGRIEIEIPFNAPPDRPNRLFLDDGQSITTEELPVSDQYTVQAHLFNQAIRENTEVPVPLEDALHNMLVLDAIFRSAASGRWELPQK